MMLINARTGSTYLGALLSQHPSVDAKAEHLATLATWKEQLDWLEEFYDEARHDTSTLVAGCKTKLQDVHDLEAFGRFLRTQDLVVFATSRRNKVKQAISAIRAASYRALTQKMYGDAVSNVGRGRKTLPPSRIEPKQIQRQVQRFHDLDAELCQYVTDLGLDVAWIFYEDLLTNPSSVLEYVARSIHVDLSQVSVEKSAVEKGTPDNLADAVLNFDELAATFHGTELYEQLLEGASRDGH